MEVIVSNAPFYNDFEKHNKWSMDDFRPMTVCQLATLANQYYPKIMSGRMQK